MLVYTMSSLPDLDQNQTQLTYPMDTRFDTSNGAETPDILNWQRTRYFYYRCGVNTSEERYIRGYGLGNGGGENCPPF